jgi:hypothetical protein
LKRPERIFIAQSTGKFLQVADVEHVQTRSRQDQNLHQHLKEPGEYKDRILSDNDQPVTGENMSLIVANREA